MIQASVVNVRVLRLGESAGIRNPRPADSSLLGLRPVDDLREHRRPTLFRPRRHDRLARALIDH